MFSHVMVGADDVAASKKFYDATLGALGVPPGKEDEKGRVFYMTATGVFAITKPINGEPASCGNGTTIGFAATSPEQRRQSENWNKAMSA
jgi:catechol 2,3-dioxygenase-like lactoylglutathione lyase family enzyme